MQYKFEQNVKNTINHESDIVIRKIEYSDNIINIYKHNTINYKLKYVIFTYQLFNMSFIQPI